MLDDRRGIANGPKGTEALHRHPAIISAGFEGALTAAPVEKRAKKEARPRPGLESGENFREALMSFGIEIEVALLRT
jgi:hypothetical protein